MRIVRRGSPASRTYFAYDNAYQVGDTYIKIHANKDRNRRILSLKHEATWRDAYLIWHENNLLLTYFSKKQNPWRQEMRVARAGWQWYCAMLDMDPRRDLTDRLSVANRARYMYQVVEQLIIQEHFGTPLRTGGIASRDNAQLRATMAAMLAEIDDLVGLLHMDWANLEQYPPSIRKARKMLGLPYRGRPEPGSIDPLAEIRELYQPRK